MGLDGVEILMEVEETFGIEIDDAAAESMRTPGDLIDAIMARTATADASVCLTQRAFYLVRKSLLRHLPLKRRDVTPASLMAGLAPKARRAQLMDQLATELGAGPLPPLGRPAWLRALLITLSVAAGFASVAALHRHTPIESWGVLFFVGAMVAAVTAFVAWAASSRACSEFPPELETAGMVARWVLAHKKDLAGPAQGHWTREQVAARVREIIITQLNCASTYREDASFEDDLGLS
jgi:acyl carrier protein